MRTQKRAYKGNTRKGQSMIWDTRQLPVLLNTTQAAQLLGVCQRQVQRMCGAGELPAQRIGRTNWRISKAALLEQLGLTE